MTHSNAVKGGPSHGHRQHAKNWPCGFRVMRADRQTNRHTHHTSQYFAPLPMSAVCLRMCTVSISTVIYHRSAVNKARPPMIFNGHLVDRTLRRSACRGKIFQLQICSDKNKSREPYVDCVIHHVSPFQYRTPTREGRTDRWTDA